MKIVQSLWSNNKKLTDCSFGWLSPQHHVMAWALSCLRLNEYYDDVSIYTDSNGHEVLIEYLDLPYSKSNIVYNDLNKNYPEKFWAVPKIKTYQSQQHPFIHVDGDVFIWKKFSEKLKKSGLICQNYENGTDYYKKMMEFERKNLINIPDSLKSALDLDSIPSVNAGILGGNDIDFIKYYSTEALKLIDANSSTSRVRHLSVNFNILFEQILFRTLIEKEGKKIECVFDQSFNDNGYISNHIADFTKVPENTHYLHIIGKKKQEKIVCEFLSRTLMQEYPSYYFKIVALFKKEHVYACSGMNTLDSCPENFSITDRSSSNSGSISCQNKLVLLQTDLKLNEDHLHTAKLEPACIDELKTYKTELQLVLNEFQNIPINTLYSIEKTGTTYFYFFNLEKSAVHRVVLQSNKYLKIIESSFTFLEQTKNFLASDVVEEHYGENLGIAIMPSLFYNGYVEISIDELDYNILLFLTDAHSFEDLLKCLSVCFDIEDANDSSLYELTMMRLKKLFFYKCIEIVS